MSYLAPVSEFLKRHQGSEIIGDTLFISGTPYIYCSICGKIEKKFNGVSHVSVVNGRKQKQLVPYKVMVGFWKREQTIQLVGLQQQIVDTVKPVIHSEPACFGCWDRQSKEKANNPGKAVFYRTNELFKEK